MAVRSTASCEEMGKSLPLTCSICDKEFLNEKGYFGHLRMHSGEVHWECERCPPSETSFESQSRLKIHENACHTLVRPHKCSKCENTFTRASQLDYHTRSVHMREKSQICQICGKGFFRKNDLTTHLNVHLGTNQSICEICGRKFNHVSNLIRHCRTHAGVKPYPCVTCGKRFTQISSLARHKRIHERNLSGGEKRILAEGDFDKSEEERSSSDRQVSANGEEKQMTKRRHYCRVCGDSFQFLVLLRQHKKLHGKSREVERIVDSMGAASPKDDGKNVERKRKRSICDKSNDIATIQPEDSSNSIGDHLLELAQNSMGIENDRDLSLSDILSSYDCNDIELTTEETLPTKLYDNSTGKTPISDISEKVDDIGECLTANYSEEQLSTGVKNLDLKSPSKPPNKQTKIRKTKISTGECRFLQIEGSQLYVEIGKTDFARSMNSQDLTIEEITNNFRCGDSFHSQDRRENFGKKDVSGETEIVEPKEKETKLRLVDRENGEEFYELIVDRRENLEGMQSPRNDEDLNFPEDETTKPEMQNLDLTSEKMAETREFLQFFPNTEEENQGEIESAENEALPMVRLVQNEDGEQFFELIREEPLDYEKDRSCEKEFDLLTGLELPESTSHVKSSTFPTAQKRDKKETTETAPKNPVAKDRVRKFQCNVCDKWFSTAYNFRQHTGTHFSDKQKFHCEHCGLTFAWKSTLNKHLAGNHRPDGPQKFVCEICPKVYSTLSQVNEHVKRDHLKERNHLCGECGKAFFKKFDLKTHSRTHTNERPYICRACGKGFHHQSHIIRHERIHSGERPYACNICQRTFTQPGSLKSHRQRHRDVKIDILEYRMDEDDPLSLAAQ